jgi:hypothetical protein
MAKHDARDKLAAGKQISAPKAEGRQYERMIATVNGLSIRVSQSGQKTFQDSPAHRTRSYALRKSEEWLGPAQKADRPASLTLMGT